MAMHDENRHFRHLNLFLPKFLADFFSVKIFFVVFLPSNATNGASFTGKYWVWITFERSKVQRVIGSSILLF